MLALLPLTFQTGMGWKPIKANCNCCQVTPWMVIFVPEYLRCCSHRSLDFIVDHTTTGKLLHPTPPAYFSILPTSKSWELQWEVHTLLLRHLPPNEAPKTLSFSNMKPCVVLSYLMTWPCSEIFWGPHSLQLFILLWDKDNLTFCCWLESPKATTNSWFLFVLL